MVDLYNEETQVQFAIKAVNHIRTIQKKIRDMIKNGKSSKYSFDDLGKECDNIISALYIVKNGSLDDSEDDIDKVIDNMDNLETSMNNNLRI